MPGPARSVLEWAAREAAPGSRVAGVRGLREGAGPWLIRLVAEGSETTVVARLDAPRELFRTELAALKCAEDLGVPAPRVIAADLDGDRAGVPAMLLTALAGSSRIPVTCSPARLRVLGAAAATLHRIRRVPGPDLPLRTRAIAPVDFPGERHGLLGRAKELVARTPMPVQPTVFVHGDLWQGNTMWVGDELAGIVDWDCAGAGPYGVDLGSLRLDAAVLYGLPAAGAVLDGWQEAMGEPAEHVAYWDLVTVALSTPVDLAEWLPVIHDQGRTDLDVATITERRDAFLADALGNLRG